MSQQDKNGSPDQTPGAIDEANDLLFSPENRTTLRALAQRRALLRDEKWRALMRGTASPEVIAELEAEAKSSPEAQALFELARPSTVAPADWIAANAAKIAENRPKLVPPAEVPAAKVRALAPKPYRTIVRNVGVGLALAAGVAAIWFGWKSTRPAAPIAARPMPAFEMKAEGGIAKTLGSETRRLFELSARSESMLTLELTPPPSMLVSQYGKLRGQAFLVRFGTITPLNMPIVVDASGKTIVKGTRNELFPDVPDGVYELWIAIGPESEVSPDPEKLIEQARKKQRTMSISRVSVELTGGKATHLPILDVSFTGCTEVVLGPDFEPLLPECVVDGSGKVQLRMKATTGASLTGRTPHGDMNGDLQLATTAAGTTVDVDVKNPEGEVQVVATLGERRAVFRLPLRPSKPSPEIENARKMAGAGKRKEAFVAAEALTQHANIEVRARAYALMGRIDKDEKRYVKAIEHLGKAIELNRQLGRVSAELSDGMVLSQIHTVHRQDPKMREQVFGELGVVAASVPDALVKLPYYGAGGAAQSGDLRTALRLYDQTLRMAEKHGFKEFEANTQFALAAIFASLGRLEDARALRRAFMESSNNRDASPCDLADNENQAGWVEYLASLDSRYADQSLDEAKIYLERALTHGCDNGFNIANIETNLALVALARGRFDDVPGHLDKAKKADDAPEPSLEEWWALADSRVLIARAPTEPRNAQLALEKLEKLLTHAKDPEVRLDAWLARAEAYDVLGDKTARKAYAEADRDALRYALSVELTTGAGAFQAVHGRSTEKRVDYLLRLAEKEPQRSNEILLEAAEAVRRSRLRVLASLPGRIAVDDSLETRRKELSGALDKLNAQLAKSASPMQELQEKQQDVNREFAELLESIGLSPDAPLAKPAAGELVLVYHALERGYVGFAMDEHGRVVAKRLDILTTEQLSPAEIAIRVLEPFRTQIEAAKRIRFIPHGAALARVDFHVLPWKDGKLIEFVPVAYGVDFGTPRIEVTQEDAAKPNRALLVVGDPNRTLPGAERESQAVAEQLQGKLGYTVKRQSTLTGGEIADFWKTLSSNDVRFFHFVGHGYFESLAPKGGTPIYRPDLDGWESGLRLGDGGLLSPRRVMLLDRVPQWIVLSACEVGSMVDKADGLSFGLPQAFVVKGARAVVAATVPLVAGTPDKLGFHEKLVEKLMASSAFPADLPAALRDALMGLRGDNEWATFRVFVP